MVQKPFIQNYKTKHVLCLFVCLFFLSLFLGDCEFPCHNGKCIPRRYVCNNHDNCGDNTDEIDIYCGEE